MCSKHFLSVVLLGLCISGLVLIVLDTFCVGGLVSIWCRWFILYVQSILCEWFC